MVAAGATPSSKTASAFSTVLRLDMLKQDDVTLWHVSRLRREMALRAESGPLF